MWPISSEVQCTNQKHTTRKQVTAAKGGKILKAVNATFGLRAEHAQQELDTIRAEPFLGTKHMYRKKRFCLQGGCLKKLSVN